MIEESNDVRFGEARIIALTQPTVNNLSHRGKQIFTNADKVTNQQNPFLRALPQKSLAPKLSKRSAFTRSDQRAGTFVAK